MALIIKDGNNSSTTLKTTLISSEHVPHHVVQGVSGTVAVTSSVSSPVYVTGAVTVSQPISVDVVVGDAITASIQNVGFQQVIDAVTESYNSSGGYGKFNVKITGSSTVTIDNTGATNAFMALSGANLNDKFAVQITGSNVIKTGNYDALLVRTTGNVESLVMNTGFSSMIDSITGSSNATSVLHVKLTGSNTIRLGNYDAVFVRTTGTVESLIMNPGFSAMIDDITGSSNGTNPLYVNVSGADSFGQKFFDHAMVAISHSYYNSTGGASNYIGVKFPPEYTQEYDAAHKALLVRTTGSDVRIDNQNFDTILSNLITASHTFGGQLAIKVKTTGSSNVTIDNTAADVAFTALSYSFADNSIKVKLTGSNTTYENGKDILYVRGTGSQTEITNTGFNQLINYITAATDLGNSDYRLKVITTGSSAVTINNTAADVAFTALSYSFADNSIKVKLTGSNTIQESGYDILRVRTTGSSVTVDNTGFQQVINYLTSAYNSGDNVGKFNVHLTGNSNVTIDNQNFGNAINSIFSASHTFDGQLALKVKITGSSETEVINYYETPLHITASRPLLVTEKPARTTEISNFYWPAGFNWSTNSGTFILAADDEDRRGLIINNPSDQNLYIALGGGVDNGFGLNGTGSAPGIFSFIIYPSGTYTAEPVMASVTHAGFFVSQSNFTQLPFALSTKVKY